jgi:hypothetical protein
MVDSKITACAKVPKELYDASIQKYTKISTAIIAGLELLVKGDSIPNGIQNEASIQNSIPNQTDSIRDLETRLDNSEVYKALLEEKEIRITELKESYQNQIEELKTQTLFLQDQMKEKDLTIKNLTTITESQLKSYRLIEAPAAERKKSWWKFW